ncbi:MAG: hypothetical protein RL325_1204 [Planctomycetota bacterium]
MAQKLNKKLVFFVGSLVLLLALGGAVFFALRFKYDAERHIRQGDALMQEGDFKKAADAYGRAVAKKKTNIAYLEKFQSAIVKITPETENDARERYQQYLGVLASIARASRDDTARWRDYLGAFREQAEAFDNSQTWKSFSDRCDDMLQTVAEDGLNNALARLYRGYAGFRRIDSLNESERAAVVADIEAGLKAKELTPEERDIGVGSLARLAVRDRAIASSAGRSDRVEQAQEAMVKALERAATECPDGLRTAIANCERALFEAQGKAKDPQVTATMERLGQIASKWSDGIALLEVGNVMLRGGSMGLEEAQDMLGQYAQRNPQAYMHRRAYAAMLRGVDTPTARRELQAIIAAPQPNVGLLGALHQTTQTISALALFDLAFDDAERASGPEKAQKVADCVASRESVAKLLEGAPDQSPLIRADGKIALLKDDPMTAIVKFNEVFRKGSQIDLELYVLSAIANMRIQELGRALELVNGGLNVAPGNIALLKLRARLELSTARPREAVATLKAVTETFPDDAEAQELYAQAKRMAEGDTALTSSTDAVLEASARIQAAAEAKDFDGARRMLNELRQKVGGVDVRVTRVSAAVELQANNLDAARQIVKQGLEQFPGDPALVRLNAVLASDDIVERVIALAEGAVSDEKERTVLTYLRMLQTGQTVREQATREKRLRMASAAATEQAAVKLEAATKEWRTKAEQADRAHPGLLEADFNAALEAKDYAGCEAVAKLSEQSRRDLTQAPIFRARVLLAQDKSQDAAQVLERSIQSGVDASVVYRLLGASLERLGNVEGALRNYEESYKRRPSDMATVRLLVGALVRSGNPQRGLEVLRQARSLAGFDDEVGNTWLMLEGQMGDRRLAQRMRESRRAVAPADLENSIALAALLATSAPEREDVVSDTGKIVYSELQWNGLDASTRLRETDAVRDAWRKRSEEVFQDVLRRDPKNIDAASAYSGLLRTLGRMAEAESAVKAAVDAGGVEAGWRGLVVLGQLQCALNAEDRAKASFAEAIKREDPASRDATRAIADTLMGMERFAMAMEYLQPLVQADPRSGMKMRLAECLLRLNKPAEARAMFDQAVVGMDRELATELLDGAIQVAAGDVLRMGGDLAGARAAFEKALVPYQRAKQIAPAIPQPFIQDAMLKRKLFELTGERARGEEALASADRAVQLGATFYPASATRSEVLVVLGDLNGAVAELERYLRIAPTAVDARRRLIDILYANNALDRAEETLRAAIGYAPGEPGWHFTLGDLLARRGKLADAAASYARADKLRPDADTFYRELDARIRGRDFRGAIDACRARGEFIRTSPTARAYLGAALVAIGEKGDGVATLKESFSVVKRDFDAGNSKPMQAWYNAVRLIFAPALLNEAESLVKEVSGGDPTAVGWEYLSFLALGNDSAGPARVVAYLEPLADQDFSKMPEFAAILFDRLGTSYYLTNRCNDAIRMYERAMKAEPSNHAVLNNYAYLCVECQKDTAKALPAARLAVQLQPTRAEYIDTLAVALITAGSFQEGLDYADRAAKLANSAQIQLHRAMALKGLNQREPAILALRQAEELNPDPPTKALISELLASLK